MSKNVTIRRYPETSNNSLQAWNAGDEYILEHLSEIDLSNKTVAVCNDRFGYLSCYLHEAEPLIMIHRKSQEKSIRMNLEENQLRVDSGRWFTPFEEVPGPIDIAVLQVPKSLDLFRFFLHKLSASLAADGTVICSFMTKYFTPALLEVSREYFEEAEQSRAVKKSRLLILKKKKSLPESSFIDSFEHTFAEGTTETLSQYPGVFSAGQVDYATSYLLSHLKVADSENRVLDLGSGNGVIARAVQMINPDAQVHLVDDSIFAIESSKLNVESANSHFYWDDTLNELDDQSFDLVVSNPPFHFGHEITIEVSVTLFREAAGILKKGGRFLCVANQHLGYKPHLKKFFRSVEVLSQNKKFVVYECRKAT